MILYSSDIEAIAPLELAGFFVGWKKPLSPEQHRRLLAGSTHFVAAFDPAAGRVVGFITALSDGVNSAFIPLLEVLPEVQGRGIGTRLMEEMLQLLSGITNVDLMCEDGLQPFYQRFGMLKSSGMVLRKYLSE